MHRVAGSDLPQNPRFTFAYFFHLCILGLACPTPTPSAPLVSLSPLTNGNHLSISVKLHHHMLSFPKSKLSRIYFTPKHIPNIHLPFIQATMIFHAFLLLLHSIPCFYHGPSQFALYMVARMTCQGYPSCHSSTYSPLMASHYSDFTFRPECFYPCHYRADCLWSSGSQVK